MKRVLNITNHQPTEPQVFQLKNHWGVEELIGLSADLAQAYANVPPELSNLDAYAKQFIKWIQGQNLTDEDMVWIQGEAGLSYILISYCLLQKYKVIHATSKRIISSKGETPYMHHKFREYQVIEL